MILYRFFTILLIPLFLIHSWAYIVSPSVVYAAEMKITPLPPETMETEPVEIPVEPVKKETSKWWYILGIVAILGVASAAGGGGGGSSSGGGNGDGGGSGGSTGGYTVTW